MESFPLASSQTVTHSSATFPETPFLHPQASCDAAATAASKRLLRATPVSTPPNGALGQHLPALPKELIFILYADLLPQEMSISCFKRKHRHAPETRLQRSKNQYREKVISRDPPGKLSYSQGSMCGTQGNEKSVRTVLGISTQGSLLMISRNTFH